MTASDVLFGNVRGFGEEKDGDPIRFS